MFDEDSVIIQTGALTDSMGMILHTNIGAEQLTGYSVNELTIMNIDKLMPNPYRMKHQGYLEEVYYTGITTILNREQVTYLKNKAGCIVPISLLVKPMFDSKGCNFYYLSYVQIFKEKTEVVLTNRFGKIYGFTEQLGHFFGWGPEEFERRQFFIQCFIPKFLPVFESIS
jgi:PAS domain S-box-containing protein